MSLEISVFHIVNALMSQLSTTSYRLHVTNLEEVTLEYLVEYWYHPLGNLRIKPSEFREVQATRSMGSGVFCATHRFSLAPQQTGIVELRWTGDGSRSVNLSGHVKMRLPRRRTPESRGGLRPQFDRPVRVLLHAEAVTETMPELSWRSSYQDKDGYVIGRGGSVGKVSPLQDVASIALASGKAHNELPPDGAFVIGRDALATVTAGLQQGAEGRIRGATEDLPDHDRADALLELLAEIRPERATLDDLNALLVRVGSHLQVAASTVSKPKKP